MMSYVTGQLLPVGGSYDDYTVAGALVISTIFVCNQNTSACAFTIAVIPSGTVLEKKNYLYYQITLDGNDTFAITCGLTLNTGDVVRVFSDIDYVSFNIFGKQA